MAKLKLTKKYSHRLDAQYSLCCQFNLGDKVEIMKYSPSCTCKKKMFSCTCGAPRMPTGDTSRVVGVRMSATAGVVVTLYNGCNVCPTLLRLVETVTPASFEKLALKKVRDYCDEPMKGVCK